MTMVTFTADLRGAALRGPCGRSTFWAAFKAHRTFAASHWKAGRRPLRTLVVGVDTTVP